MVAELDSLIYKYDKFNVVYVFPFQYCSARGKRIGRRSSSTVLKPDHIQFNCHCFVRIFTCSYWSKLIGWLPNCSINNLSAVFLSSAIPRTLYTIPHRFSACQRYDELRCAGLPDITQWIISTSSDFSSITSISTLWHEQSLFNWLSKTI